MRGGWLVMPYEVEPRLLEWREKHPSLVELDCIEQWIGLKAYAVAVTDSSVPREKKRACFFGVPHAHEPAGTAACMAAVEELLSGANERALRELVLVFVPDGNPDGRRRAPVRFWTGQRFSNEEFWTWMRGRDPGTKKMWKRLGEWSRREHEPETVGIVYEQTSAHEWVEPNRSEKSSYCRLFRMMDERWGFERKLELHQTEFARRTENCEVLLPIVQNGLPLERARENEEWGREIIAAWRELGARPIDEPKVLGYGPDQGDYFRRLWGEVYKNKYCVTSEVQNNNSATPPDMQVRLSLEAIRATVRRMLG